MTEKMRNQWRSWKIMEKYFGIIQPGCESYPLNLVLPPAWEKALEEIRQQALVWEKERIAKN